MCEGGRAWPVSEETVDGQFGIESQGIGLPVEGVCVVTSEMDLNWDLESTNKRIEYCGRQSGGEL